MAFVVTKRVQQQFLQDLELSPAELDRRERNRSKVRRSYYRKIVRPIMVAASLYWREGADACLLVSTT